MVIIGINYEELDCLILHFTVISEISKTVIFSRNVLHFKNTFAIIKKRYKLAYIVGG
jgi:hypothetical protein